MFSCIYTVVINAHHSLAAATMTDQTRSGVRSFIIANLESARLPTPLWLLFLREVSAYAQKQLMHMRHKKTSAFIAELPYLKKARHASAYAVRKTYVCTRYKIQVILIIEYQEV